MQPGSLVFVQSNPTVNEKGEVTPGLVHIYMVSSPTTANSPTSKLGPTSGTPVTPGGCTSNEFSLIRTPGTESVQPDVKIPHSPSILRKSPKRTPPHNTVYGVLADGESVSITLSESHTILTEPELAIPESNGDGEITGIQTVEIMNVDAPYDGSGVLTVHEQQVNETEDLANDNVAVINDDGPIVSVEMSGTADDAV